APASLIQSDYVTNGHGHYEALVQQGRCLNHYVNYQDGTGYYFSATVTCGFSPSGNSSGIPHTGEGTQLREATTGDRISAITQEEGYRPALFGLLSESRAVTQLQVLDQVFAQRARATQDDACAAELDLLAFCL